MNSRPRWPCALSAALLDILDLLPHLLELRLGVDDQLRDAQAVGLGADGVDLAVHLLEQEIELPAARLRAVGQRVPVHQVAPEPGELFADIRPRRRADDLLRDESLIDGELEINLVHALVEAALHPLTPLRTTRRLIREMQDDIGSVLRSGDIDAMVIEHQSMAAYLRPTYPSHVKCVVRFQSLTFKAFARTAAHSKFGLMKLVNLMQAVTSRWFERGILRNLWFDELWFLLPSDLAEAAALAPGVEARCRILPIGVEDKSGPVGDAEVSIPGIAPSDKVIAFLGSMRNPSNQDGARWLAKVILPKVRKRVPDARLVVVGRDAQVRLADISGEHVVVVGDAPDLRPYLSRSDVYAVAERGESGIHASGIHMKLIDGLSAAKVLVASPVGTGGIDELTPGVHYVVARDEDEFVEAIVDVLDNPARFRGIAERGHEFFLEHFSSDAAGRAIEARLLTLAGENARIRPRGV